MSATGRLPIMTRNDPAPARKAVGANLRMGPSICGKCKYSPKNEYDGFLRAHREWTGLRSTCTWRRAPERRARSSRGRHHPIRMTINLRVVLAPSPARRLALKPAHPVPPRRARSWRATASRPRPGHLSLRNWRTSEKATLPWRSMDHTRHTQGDLVVPSRPALSLLSFPPGVPGRRNKRTS